MRKTARLFAVLTLFTLTAKAQFVSLNDQEISRLKRLIDQNSNIKKQFLHQQNVADAALTENPAPIDTLHTEGRLKGDPQKTATIAALKDMGKMYALALVYRLYGNEKYEKQTVAFLTAWAKTNRSNGDPIDDTNLDAGIEAFDLIKEKINSQDKEKISNWLKQVANAEINSKKMKPGHETSYNNWNSHRLKIVGEIAYTLNNETFKNYAVNGFKDQLNKNLKPDGSSIDFELRDALHYHIYDLEALLKLIIVPKRATGVDYYSYVSEKQTSVKKSVEWTLPYLTEEKIHAEFVNSKVAFDKARANNNEPDYKTGANFHPKYGANMLSLAAYFQPQYLSVLQKLKGTSSAYPDWQSVLNATTQQ